MFDKSLQALSDARPADRVIMAKESVLGVGAESQGNE